MIGRRGRVFVLFAVLLAAGCGESVPGPEATGRPGAVATPAPVSPGPAAPAPTPGPGEDALVPVYYVAETAAGPRLQREFHAVVTSDPASAAVREMLASPTGNDPDYLNYWPSGTALREPVRRDGQMIVVDLTGVAPAKVGTDLAELSVQQLVFTVQAALQSTDPVQILVDGARAPEPWGAGEPADHEDDRGPETPWPFERGDPYALRSLVQIDAPAEGAQVGREVEVRGEAAVFEATVLWEVLRDGAIVQKGFTSTAEGQRFAPFAFTVNLEPGEYTVRIREDDPSDGEGRPVLTDDKTFTVVG
jgi:hypothetical protein